MLRLERRCCARGTTPCPPPHAVARNITRIRYFILVLVCLQEIVKPDVFWYTSGATVELPFDITGLVAFELFVMHVSR